ncbi:12057_t:CDS:1, partial [Gigaspora rosea]
RESKPVIQLFDPRDDIGTAKPPKSRPREPILANNRPYDFVWFKSCDIKIPKLCHVTIVKYHCN